MVIWLIGLSGAGKTTIGSRLVERLRESHKNTVFIDGDMIREVWGDDLGHSADDRRKNSERISKLCRFLEEQGIIVVAAVLSIFPEWQDWNRKNFENYFQAFLEVKMDVLKKRDTKGLYSRVEDGELKNVVGVDIPFPTPVGSDITLDASGDDGTPEELTERILSVLPNKLTKS